ncbi:PorP/SprF family type IX secretion system membrane protein [Mesonia aestuariivivens]|uniref:Type IX secretion system membrane protein PorP/SprF n=1 Tax=Mesonia aestuariivivens TaxID=2796128 RepID=A0ABS6VZP5_9FLAO|nr:type IX secretion system membrane protein PorP/SprF [Mesonia aestuariivivens]MBW2961071.1 type IX secretion system membrane protein PorP/SprF [Mesonia aestuariivivens]
MKIKLLILIIFSCYLDAFCQQDPEFTHYMYNMKIINPGYVNNSPETIYFGGFYRKQWVDVIGNPTTYSFFTHLPLSSKLEAGISFVNDEIGENALKENNVTADLAYILKVSKTIKISFGLKAGATFLDTDFSRFRLESGNTSTDPAFSQNIHQTYPTLGTGAFLFSKNYYLGLSTPNFLKSKHLKDANHIQRIGGEEIHMYLTGGYVFKVSQSLKVKPSFLLRTVNGASSMIDISANFLYLDRFEAGVSYRYDDSISALMSIGITTNLKFGYAYDYTTTNLGNFTSGTHEFFLLYNLDLSKGYHKSPRFF